MQTSGIASENNGILKRNGARRPLGNETGAALIMALVFIIAILALVPAALNMYTADQKRSSNYKDSRTGFYIAEAGVELAKNTIKNTVDISTIYKGADGSSSTIADNGLIPDTGSAVAINGNYYTQVSFNGGTYSVRIYDNSDGDNDLFADNDGLVNIESRGTFNSQTKVIDVTTSKYSLPPSTFPSAVTLVGASTVLTVSSNTFTVAGGNPSGYDVDGNVDNTCAGKHGTAFQSTGAPQVVQTNANCPAGTTTCIKTNNANFLDNITGSSGTGLTDLNAGVGQTSFTDKDALELWNKMTQAGMYNQKWTGNTVLSGNATYGSSTDPQTLYFTGNAKINGTLSGTGILIVDGDLDIQGNLNWNGIVIVGACSSCTGKLVGTGGAEIQGAMVVGNTVTASDTNNQATFSGNATIQYSCEAINQANGAFKNTFKVVSWNEKQ